jgi:pimeloyl-ACP methyl ester carboxylesterase
MADSTLTVQGIEVLIDGTGPDTVLMLHGWPDNLALWDSTVAALQSRFRCVRFTLPGFDLTQPPSVTPLEQMTALIAAIADASSPHQAITLLMHDWGCTFGYEFAARHPARVARIVAVDIGDHNTGAFMRSLSVKAKFQIMAYQLWLALAWKIGNALSSNLGNWMTRWMAAALRCRNAPDSLGWQMNYPYAMLHFGLAGGLRQTLRVAPSQPLLYLYGKRKPFMFHSPQWLTRLTTQTGCAAQGFDTGHWIMVEQPQAFNQSVLNWLVASSY